MCFDAMSAVGIQRAQTPNFNYMIANGAVSMHTRCGLTTIFESIREQKLVVDNDGSHTLTTKYGFAELSEGVHEIRIEYFEDCEGQYLFVNYRLDGEPLRPFFPEEFVR